MSRNKQRTVAATDAVAATTATTPTAPASLSYVTPTEFVELPSRGQFYSTDHPLYEKDVIEMRYMTAKDEDILTSPALLKKGVAIDRLLQNLVVDKNINPNNLLIGDKNALLLAARISGYGEEYPVVLQCNSCGEAIKSLQETDPLRNHAQVAEPLEKGPERSAKDGRQDPANDCHGQPGDQRGQQEPAPKSKSITD